MWFLTLSINYINIIANVFSEVVSKKEKNHCLPRKIFSKLNLTIFRPENILFFLKILKAHQWQQMAVAPQTIPYPCGVSSQAKNDPQSLLISPYYLPQPTLWALGVLLFLFSSRITRPMSPVASFSCCLRGFASHSSLFFSILQEKPY